MRRKRLKIGGKADWWASLAGRLRGRSRKASLRKLQSRAWRWKASRVEGFLVFHETKGAFDLGFIERAQANFSKIRDVFWVERQRCQRFGPRGKLKVNTLSFVWWGEGWPKRATGVVKRRAPWFDEKREFFDRAETIPKRECSYSFDEKQLLNWTHRAPKRASIRKSGRVARR